MESSQIAMLLSKGKDIKISEFHKNLAEEIDKLCIDTNFRDEMIRHNIKSFGVKGTYSLSFPFLHKMLECLKSVTRRALEGMIMDRVIEVGPDLENDPDFMDKLTALNWSYHLKTMDGQVVDILDDFENLFLNFILSQKSKGIKHVWKL